MKGFSKQEFSWTMYDWGNSAYSMTITSTLLPIFFKLVYKNSGGADAMSTAYWGYANSIGTLIVALLAPILGTLADYKGYKKKFFSVFLILGVAFTALLAVVPNDFWMLLLAFYLLNSIGFSGSLIFYDAFLVDVTTKKRMDKVSAWGFGLGYIGSTIPFIVCMALVILSQNQTIALPLAGAFKISFVITAIWWAVFTIPLLRHVKQTSGIEPESKPIQNSFKRIAKTFREVSKHRTLFIFLLAYFFYIDGVNTIITMATSYGTDLHISSTTLIVVLLVTQFVAFPFSILYGKLSDIFRGKIMLYVGVITYIGITIYAYFIKTSLDFWILAMLVGTAQGGIQALSRSYFGKLVPRENSNEFFGFYNIFGKFAAIMGPFLVGFVTMLTQDSRKGILSVIILFVIGMVILIKVPNEINMEKN